MEYINKVIGAIFCQVNIIMEFIHVSPSIISGNQKWKGAAPIFIKNVVLRINEIYILVLTLYIKLIDIIIILNNIIVEAIVWVIKYFIAASEFCILLVFLIKGIIESRLISSPIHIPIHE